ncbi:hypothetical protein [Streptosporangium sp. NPDC087985]|uniref:hypothetical protein n=1 Tax=Streptosporangium sp. NPDC087985 TaxID=3366196 RepID=UPI0037F64551
MNATENTVQNATEIVAEMARLSALLPVALTSDDFDGDYAAVLGRLSLTLKHTATTLDVVADAADNSDGPGWETVTYEADRAHQLLITVSEGVNVAAKAAEAEQAKTASLLDRIRAETRGGDAFFKALANLDGAVTSV